MATHLQLLHRDEVGLEVVDGSKRIDLMLARTMAQSEARYERLVVELKWPSILLGQKEYNQITNHARAVASDERYGNVDVRWEFILVGNAYDDWLKMVAHEPGRPVWRDPAPS